MAGGAEEYNAFYYSLVSTDTQEMYYSAKRQQFLIDQGYAFKVVTSLPPADAGDSLLYGRLEDQLDLLAKVLNAGDAAAVEEAMVEDIDDLAHIPRAVRRMQGSMSAMSGAQGMVYMEYRYVWAIYWYLKELTDLACWIDLACIACGWHFGCGNVLLLEKNVVSQVLRKWQPGGSLACRSSLQDISTC